MKLEVIRYEYLVDRTIGQCQIDGAFFCYTLEDRVRPASEEKVYGETAIPEGIYPLEIRPLRGDPSRPCPHLSEVPGFTGVAIHGGNGPLDTLGCILVGFNRDGEKIYGSAVRALVEKITPHLPMTVTVRNGG